MFQNLKRVSLISVVFVLSLVMSGCHSITGDTENPALSKVASKITAAINGKHRSEKNIARNSHRHPMETLAFFGVEENMTVIEISPGGLWYGEILAPVLKDHGQYVAAAYDSAVPDQPAYRYKQVAAMEARFTAEPEYFEGVQVVGFSPPSSMTLGSANSADRVLTFRNSHGWARAGIADKVYQAFYDVLKPGGVLGVVQHRGEHAELPGGVFSGYLTERAVIGFAKNAGFELEARSEINANPNDTADHAAGVWSLPPVLRLKDVDKEKYLAIGESDRMTLRFRKPK